MCTLGEPIAQCPLKGASWLLVLCLKQANQMYPLCLLNPTVPLAVLYSHGAPRLTLDGRSWYLLQRQKMRLFKKRHWLHQVVNNLRAPVEAH